MANQVVKCQCGSIFAACAEPYCYQDDDWIKNLKAYSKSGCKIEMSETGVKFEWCECDHGKLRRGEIKELPIKNQTSLF